MPAITRIVSEWDYGTTVLTFSCERYDEDSIGLGIDVEIPSAKGFTRTFHTMGGWEACWFANRLTEHLSSDGVAIETEDGGLKMKIAWADESRETVIVDLVSTQCIKLEQTWSINGSLFGYRIGYRQIVELGSMIRQVLTEFEICTDLP